MSERTLNTAKIREKAQGARLRTRNFHDEGAFKVARNLVVQLCDEVDRLRAALDQVRALHLGTMRSGDLLICRECGDDFPCPTLQAVGGPDPT